MKIASFLPSPGNAHGCHFLPGNQAGFRIYKGCRDTPFISALPCSCFPEPVSSFLAWDPANKTWMQHESSARHSGGRDDGLRSVPHSGLCMQGC